MPSLEVRGGGMLVAGGGGGGGGGGLSGLGCMFIGFGAPKGQGFDSNKNVFL